MYDVSSLSPEEKDKLLQMLIEKTGIEPTQTEAPMGSEQIEKVISVVEMLIDRIESLTDRVDANEKLLVDELIGGVTNLYNAKKREGDLSCLREKYKDRFDPYSEFYKEGTEGTDLYEALLDEISSMKEGREDWSDEEELGKVGEIEQELKSRFEKMKGLVTPKSEVAIEVTKAEGNPDDHLSNVQKMRKKFGDKQIG